MINRIIHNCNIDSAYNGEQCLKKIIEKNKERKGCTLCSKPYRVIFMDFDMPVMDGLTAARKIRELVDAQILPGIPVIGCTAFVFENEREKCIEAGMSDYLSKPVVYCALQEIFKRFH
jgi:CheY-like chemotaxis protein